MNALAALPLALLAIAPQDPQQVLARFQLEGKHAVVTQADVALEMAFHLRRRERAQQACDLLVDTTLTRRAATKKRLMPTETEVQAFWKELQQQLRDAGHRPEQFAAIRNTSQQQWLQDLAVQMAQERLVRAELNLGAKEPVSPDMLKLWLQEERRKCNVVTDADVLPAGTCARVDDIDVPLLELGLLLLRTSEDEERDESVRRIVYLQSIEALARKRGVLVTDADLDAAVQRRRDDAARDPRYSGVGFEQMLKAEGLTIASLRQLRVFRAHVLLDKLAEILFPDDTLRLEVQRDRQAVLDLVGPRRRLGVIFVRAMDEPNALVPLDFPAATKKLTEVRQRLATETFENTARIESHDPPSKQRGGDTGWHRRRSTELPDAVLAAAFTLRAGEVSLPVRTDEGCYLVKALDVEADPTDAMLVTLLRAFRAMELRQTLLRDAAIEVVPPAPAGGR